MTYTASRRGHADCNLGLRYWYAPRRLIRTQTQGGSADPPCPRDVAHVARSATSGTSSFNGTSPVMSWQVACSPRLKISAIGRSCIAGICTGPLCLRGVCRLRACSCLLPARLAPPLGLMPSSWMQCGGGAGEPLRPPAPHCRPGGVRSRSAYEPGCTPRAPRRKSTSFAARCGAA